MQVGVMQQVRTPSVKHGEKAELGAQVLGISGDGE
jgi:predicted RNA-binding protein with TRAM domain